PNPPTLPLQEKPMRFQKILVPAMVLALSVIGSTAAADVKAFTNDGNHTRIRFVAETVLFQVDGWFDRYKVNIKGDPEKLTDVAIKLEIQTASINTSNQKRDEHLRNPDFFNAPKNPTITFT